MNLAVVRTRAKTGIHAPEVMVEVHLSGGLPCFNMVGLPEAAVRESKERVRSAILNSLFEFPQRRITVNLAPADLPKEGGRFDLPIAIGILAASGQIPAAALDNYEFCGELALTGELRPVPGILPAAVALSGSGRGFCLPADNAAEASLSAATRIIAAGSLSEICAHLSGALPLEDFSAGPEIWSGADDSDLPDLMDVRGQTAARRALEVAAAGQHNLLFFGPPGTGKTLLASRLPSILPEMTEAEMLEVASVYSVAGVQRQHLCARPFRTPHHTASGVALAGGGSVPRPGEISLAHNGVLFLDELPEFPRTVLDVLREPLENGSIVISRAARQVTFPARFQLIAAMNPTPGGYAASDARSQHYTREQINRYLSKISGPFLDRIDMHVEVPPVATEVLMSRTQSESSAAVRERVRSAWQRQLDRQNKGNHLLSPRELDSVCLLPVADSDFLKAAIDRLKLSARSYHRILKVARTIADLDSSPAILRSHLAEALTYRQLDRLSQTSL